MTQHTTRLGLHIKNFAVVALQRQVICASKTGGSCTDNSHLLTSWRVFNKWHWWIKQASLSGMAVHTANSDFFFDQSPTASLLTWSGTGQTQDKWEGQHLFYQACSLFHRAFRDQFQVARNVDMRGAIDLARRLAVGVVITEHHLQVGAPNMEQFVRLRRDDHARSCRCITRRQGTCDTFDVNKTHATGGCWLQLLIVTQVRDIVDPMVYGHAQDRLAFVRPDGFAIEGKCEAGLTNLIAYHRYR